MEFYYSINSFVVYARDKAIELGWLQGNPATVHND